MQRQRTYALNLYTKTGPDGKKSLGGTLDGRNMLKMLKALTESPTGACFVDIWTNRYQQGPDDASHVLVLTAKEPKKAKEQPPLAQDLPGPIAPTPGQPPVPPQQDDDLPF